jgi:hypothetical protein
MILVRNCPHDNGIYTLVDDVSSLVIKSTYTVDGIYRLSNEFAGYHWYLQQKGWSDDTQLRFVRNNNGSYCRLYIQLFSGRGGECYKNLRHNRDDLFRAVNAYAQIWPRKKGRLAPLHGDFSLGNMLFHGNELTIIDWEHFQPEAAPWGFDLVNLLYEAAFFSFKGESALSHHDSRVFVEIRKAIIDLLDPAEGFKCMLKDLTYFVSTNVPAWGKLVNKLPVTKFSGAQKEHLIQLEHE